MEKKNIYEGKFLTRNLKQDSVLISAMDYLWARIAAALLWPFHMLGEKRIYQRIHSTIGISKAGISGGGSLPLNVDRFFEAIGVKVLNGYGLTEATAAVAARGPPHNNPSATKEALDEEGWLSTGDIGWIVPRHNRGRSRNCGGMIVLEGRAKDTIVLTTGENVEPLEIEEAAMRSKLIQQIVVFGQDQRRLGAVIVPNKEELSDVAKQLSISDGDASKFTKGKIINLLQEEVRI